MIRRLTTALISLLAKIFFRRIEIAGSENVPIGDPIIFAVNHPNGLIDPLFLLAFTPRRVSFMAKAPLFRMPLIGWLARAFDSIPVYRRQDNMPTVPPNWLFYVGVKDINAAIAATKKGGGKVMMGPMEVPGGSMVAVRLRVTGTSAPACLPQRTTAAVEGTRAGESSVPLATYAEADGSRTTKPLYLVLVAAPVSSGTRVTVSAGAGGKTVTRTVWLDRVGGDGG